jgi:hypothetical protein
MSGIQIRTVLMRNDEDHTECATQTTIWPLPDDPELHTALDLIIRDAVNAELTKRGLCNGNVTDLTAKSPMQ